jgi:hypothetical protein
VLASRDRPVRQPPGLAKSEASGDARGIHQATPAHVRAQQQDRRRKSTLGPQLDLISCELRAFHSLAIHRRKLETWNLAGPVPGGSVLPVKPAMEYADVPPPGGHADVCERRSLPVMVHTSLDTPFDSAFHGLPIWSGTPIT